MRCALFAVFAAAALGSPADDESPPISPEERERLREQLDAQIERLSERIRKEPDNIQLYSARGAAYFQRGRFAESVADFDKMIALDPELAASHWRRGISLYYAKRYKDSARQFESYHTFDNVDRENGIWRYLAQVKAYGLERAREDLLKYAKDDRAPFPDLYAMFAGKLQPPQVLARIADAKIDETEREKRYFYAHLYLGLHAFTLRNAPEAKEHLRQAVANAWGSKAGGGPGYMWQVGRVHWELMHQEEKTPDRKAASGR